MLARPFDFVSSSVRCPQIYVLSTKMGLQHQRTAETQTAVSDRLRRQDIFSYDPNWKLPEVVTFCWRAF
ncbi:hypothetical protein M8J75_010202 [Diaphorina citri]|nr:hypothetical protein M8J75_010202 [Diaphorina citri]